MAGAECNDFLIPSAQTVKTRTRSPCTNTEQESTQTLGCSAAELHGKDKGVSEERQQLRKQPAPLLAPRQETCTEFRDEWEFEASTELRGPEASTLRAELREQHPRVAEQRVLAWSSQGVP